MKIIDTILDSVIPYRCVGCQKIMEKVRGSTSLTTGGSTLRLPSTMLGINRSGQATSTINSSETLTTSVLCPNCRDTLALQESLFCGVCHARLPQNRKVCHKNCPYRLGVAVSYESDIARALVHQLKFQFCKPAANALGQFLANYIERLNLAINEEEDAVVVPVPLSRRRQRERGFNQSQLIAQFFATHFSLPCRADLLVRSRETVPQSTLQGTKARRDNVADAFRVVQPHLPTGTMIILVDDVTTSGSTFHEAAKALKTAGAKNVLALAATGVL